MDRGEILNTEVLARQCEEPTGRNSKLGERFSRVRNGLEHAALDS
jgi:hypothetical protein